MVTLLLDGQPAQSVPAHAEGDNLWLIAADAARTAGWSLEPNGLCQGEVCVPIPPAHMDQWVRGGEVNLAALWRHLGRPVLHDAAAGTWLLGAGADERSERLRNLEAPDFELADLNGKRHRLSDYRGKRVFLVTWASW